MSIKVDCPLCKTRLQVPDKLAGRYVNCAHCKGQIWVGQEPAGNGTSTALRPSPAKTPQPHEATPPAPPKKVARFIASDPADSALKVADDGKLPELHLADQPGAAKKEAGQRTINPLLLLGALSMSVVMSLILAFSDVSTPTDPGAESKAVMRRRIEDNYFGAGDVDRDLEPYQVLLREAQRAYTRGDYKTQRENYRKVLEMLRAERANDERGLTGSRLRDKELEDAISVLLRGG